MVAKDVLVPAPRPEEFRRRAVALARERSKSVAESAELRISESCLRNWVAQADADESGSDTQLTSREKRELAELRREKRRLEIENQILKRAFAYFARKTFSQASIPTGPRTRRRPQH